MFYCWTSIKLDIKSYFGTSIEHNTRTSIEHPLDDGCQQGYCILYIPKPLGTLNQPHILQFDSFILISSRKYDCFLQECYSVIVSQSVIHRSYLFSMGLLITDESFLLEVNHCLQKMSITTHRAPQVLELYTWKHDFFMILQFQEFMKLLAIP